MDKPNIKLLTKPMGNTKTNKSLALGYYNPILHLSPHKSGNYGNVCASASPGCIASCLNTSGRNQWKKDQNGNLNPIEKARRERTRFFFQYRKEFFEQLQKEIDSAKTTAKNQGLKLAVRLNGTSDIRYELYNIIENNQDTIFYDYTKHINRKKLPANYSLTFSRSETNAHKIPQAFINGMNVAAVFSGSIPSFYNGIEVINGDKHDLRFLDKKNVYIGLLAKGKAKKDYSGFVIDNSNKKYNLVGVS